ICLFYLYDSCGALIFISPICNGYDRLCQINKCLTGNTVYLKSRRFAFVAIFAYTLYQRNLGKQRHIHFFCKIFASFFTKDIIFVFRQFGRCKPCHIFHQSKYRDCRELALQSDTVLKNTGSGLRSCCCYGGRAAMDEHRKIKEQHPQIVFATPGRLNDPLKTENISPYTIRYMIIDEFDKCLEMGFRDERSEIISRLKGAQRHMLRAATVAEEIPGFVNMKKTTRLDYLDKTEQVHDRVKLYEV